MSREDKELFPIGIKQFDWKKFSHNYGHGLRTYLLKESKDLNAAKQKHKNDKLAHFCVSSVFYSTITGLLLWCLSTVFNRCFVQ